MDANGNYKHSILKEMMEGQSLGEDHTQTPTRSATCSVSTPSPLRCRTPSESPFGNEFDLELKSVCVLFDSLSISCGMCL